MKKIYKIFALAVLLCCGTTVWAAQSLPYNYGFETFVPQACASVETVTFGARTYNSIVVNWTTSGAGTWNLDFKQGDLEWVERHNLTEQTLTLEDLTTGIEYTVVVYPTCNAEGAVENTFTLGYTAPVAAEAENITDAAATVQWLAVTDASSYEYDFVLPGDEADWKGTSELSATASNLAAGTDYLFLVRSVYPTGHSDADTTEFKTITIAPQNLQQEGVSTTTSATFTWEANGAAMQYQWSVDNTNWSEPIAALTATATGLTPASDYTFYLRSYYSETVQSAAISLQFSTACTVATTPFHENFEYGIPVCWKTTGTWAINEETEYSRSGKSARCDAYSSAGTLTTPSVVIPDNTWLLRFFIRNISSNASFYVPGKVIVTAEGEDPVETAFIESNTLAEQRIALTAFAGKTITITFSVNKVSSTAKVFIDDVDVTTEDILTALDNAGAEGAKATKRLENNMLIIELNGVQYNAQGARVR